MALSVLFVSSTKLAKVLSQMSRTSNCENLFYIPSCLPKQVNIARLVLRKILTQVFLISVLKPAYINTLTQALAYVINTVILTKVRGVQVGQPNKLIMSITVIGVVKNTKIPTTIRTILVALRSLLPPGLGTRGARSSIRSPSVVVRKETTVTDWSSL